MDVSWFHHPFFQQHPIEATIYKWMAVSGSWFMHYLQFNAAVTNKGILTWYPKQQFFNACFSWMMNQTFTNGKWLEITISNQPFLKWMFRVLGGSSHLVVIGSSPFKRYTFQAFAQQPHNPILRDPKLTTKLVTTYLPVRGVTPPPPFLENHCSSPR